MKKAFVLLTLIAATATMAVAQQKALPGKYAGSNTLTLFDSTGVYMEESGLSHILNHKCIEMYSFAGCAAYSTYKIDYDPLSAYCEIRRVLVHRATGKTDTLVWPEREGNVQVYDYVAPARMIYWGASQKMVEVGRLNLNDELEIWTYKKGYTYALLEDGVDGLNGTFESIIARGDEDRFVPPMRGHFYDIVPFWSGQPVKEKVYRVNVLKNKNLQYKVYNGELSSAQSFDGDRVIYTFTKNDIMPIKREPAMLASNDVETKLLLSTSPNWEAKSMWFYGVNEDYGSFNTTPELKKKVRELLVGAKSEEDSIAILTHWVADNMRYSGISMGEGEGYTLHNATMNFTDRCGVCKDKASLLIAMLRTAGFNAYAAMTMAGERIDRIPADQFNHSVTVVQRRNGRYQLLDPTWVPNVRELWSSAEQQQGYLMGLPKGADLAETPVSAPENHYVRITGKSELMADGTLVGEFTITAEGQSDAAVRSVFSARKTEWRRNVEMELTRVAPQAQITSVTYTDNDTYLKQPVKMTYKYRIPGYALVSDKELIFTPLLAKGVFSRAMGHMGVNVKEEKRLYPFKDRCSRLLEVKETVKLPAGFASQSPLPERQKVNGKSVTYDGGYTLQGNSLTFEQKASYGKRVYEVSDWSDFRNAVMAQQNFSLYELIFVKNAK